MLQESKSKPKKLPREVGLLGGGIIGGGWAAKFVLDGVDVRLYDPAPNAEEVVQKILTAARRAYRSLTFLPLPFEGKLTMVGTVTEAVRDVEFVQESAPERLELKQQLIAEASRAAAPETLIASSTSGFLPSVLQSDAKHPERVLVGHPFNPVYLLPLVEVCGGKRTNPGALERAADVYRSLNMHPVVMRKEIDAFIGNRLQEAVWREALWMVNDDVATAQEIDDVMRYSVGLRRPVLGPIQGYRITLNEDDTRKAMARMCLSFPKPWSRLTDVPAVTDEFLDKLAAQTDEVMGTTTVAEMERKRDDCIIALLRVLRTQNHAAGQTIASWERELAENTTVHADEDSPLKMLTMDIPTAWLDNNGHVTERGYFQLCGYGQECLFRYLAVDPGYRANHGTFYTLETHLIHLGELKAGDRVEVTSQVLAADEKRVHVIHVVKREGADEPAATGEQVLIHVGASTGRSTPMEGKVRERLEQLALRHAHLPRPTQVGASVRMR